MPQPRQPLPADDGDDVCEARQAAAAALLAQDDPQPLGEPNRVPDASPAYPGLGGDGVNAQGARSVLSHLKCDDAQDGLLGDGELGGDLRRQCPRRGAAAAALKTSLLIWRTRRSTGRTGGGDGGERLSPCPGSEGGSAALYGRGDGFGVGVGDLPLGVRFPQKASDIIQHGAVASGGDARGELVGEHGDPLGSKPAAQGQVADRPSDGVTPQVRLATDRIFGEDRIA